MYMWWTIAILIMVCTLMLITQVCRATRPELFGINTGYYLSGDGVWAGQMQPAAESADGSTGLVPAPLTGQQNSYLRGDGKWIQANNAPTAAEYIHVTSNNNISTTTNTIVPLPNLLAVAGSRILQPTPTTFQLAANCSYKCTGVISVVAMRVIYQWYNVTTSTLIGVAGCNSNTIQENAGPATAIISPTVQTTISLMVTYVSQGGTIYGQTQLDKYQRGPWALIEVISNNNTITQFTGATSTTNGVAGYIPAPAVGQQNYVLTGTGTWSPMITAMTPVKLTGNSVMFSSIPASARRVTVMLADVGIGGTTQVRLRLGAGGIATTGYNSNAIFAETIATRGELRDDGFHTSANESAVGERRNGTYTLSHLGNNTWVCTGHFSSWPTYNTFCAGSITLSGVLDRVQLSVTNATDTFVAGAVNVMYE